jgi:PAS domain S-box-containing protein
LKEGSSWEGELDVLDSGNELFPIWERVDAVRDVAGNILFTFNLMHDVSERKRMWETLRKQWEEHQMIFNAVPAMIWYKDKNNQLLRANKLAMETFGREDESVKQYTDCQTVIESGKTELNIEYHYRDLRREKRWMQMNKLPNQDAQGNITGAIAFAVDVTEYKQTQNSLQASEERMHLIVENMPFLLLALDEDGHIILWNRSCEELTGYTETEIVNNHRALELLYPNISDRHSIVSRWYTSNSWETRILCKDGSYKNVVWHSASKEFPIPGWYAWHVGRNVTEATATTANVQAVSEQEISINTVFEVSRLGVCLIDDRGRFVQVNQAYCDLYGYSAKELIGQPFTLVLPANKHKEAVREYYSLLMVQTEPILLVRRGEQHHDGTSLDVQMLVNRIVLKGRRRLLVCVVSKIS